AETIAVAVEVTDEVAQLLVVHSRLADRPREVDVPYDAFELRVGVLQSAKRLVQPVTDVALHFVDQVLPTRFYWDVERVGIHGGLIGVPGCLFGVAAFGDALGD